MLGFLSFFVLGSFLERNELSLGDQWWFQRVSFLFQWLDVLNSFDLCSSLSLFSERTHPKNGQVTSILNNKRLLVAFTGLLVSAFDR